VFIPGIPADTTSELIARSVGDSLLAWLDPAEPEF
jgi:hypothetical protein